MYNKQELGYRLALPSDGRARRFVNVYFVTLVRGGPEEGGWYYQSGSPVESWEVTLLPRTTQEAEKTAWVAWCEEQNEGEPSLSSVLSRGLYEVQIEDSAAAHYPKERPFYE